MNYAIEVDNISKAFGDRPVLEEVSLKVRAGTIHGFLGPNGAGKTTTMKIITGLLNSDKGRVLINGEDFHENKKPIHQEIGFLLEDPPLYKDMLVIDYLRFIGELKCIPKSKLVESINYCIDVLGLEDVKKRSIENLSKGYKQRVGIAQAIINRPKIVILDEPTVGLDPKAVLEMRNLILELKKEHTILLSSHLLHEMSLVCDQVTIISQGRIKDTGEIEDLRAKIENSQTLVLESLNWKEEVKEVLKTIEGINSIEVQKEDDSYLITMTTGISDELRPTILRKAIENDLDIIGMEKKSQTLEDIFMTITDKEVGLE